MVIRLSNKIGLKTLFMKEGEAAEGITVSLKKAMCTISEEALASGLAGLLLASHSNSVCQWQLHGLHS